MDCSPQKQLAANHDTRPFALLIMHAFKHQPQTSTMAWTVTYESRIAEGTLNDDSVPVSQLEMMAGACLHLAGRLQQLRPQTELLSHSVSVQALDMLQARRCERLAHLKR